LSSSGTWATSGFRYLGDIAVGGVLTAGAALGVGERAELAGGVVADGVEPDELAVLGQLHRSGDDRYVDGGAGPPPPGRVRRAGEADHAGAVGEPGDGQPGGGVLARRETRIRGTRSARSARSRWAWVAVTWVEPRGFEPLTSWLQTRLTLVDMGLCGWPLAGDGLSAALSGIDVAASVAAPDPSFVGCAQMAQQRRLIGHIPTQSAAKGPPLAIRVRRGTWRRPG
jgi:hypothetical protein